MDKESRAAGASGSIRLGGKVWLVSQPTPADAKSIAVFAGRRAKTALSKLTTDPGWAALTERQQDKMIDALAAREGTTNPDPDDLLQALISVEGCRFLAWIVIRRKQPDVVKEKDIDPFITEANVEAMFTELDEASGMSELKNSAGLPG